MRYHLMLYVQVINNNLHTRSLRQWNIWNGDRQETTSQMTSFQPVQYLASSVANSEEMHKNEAGHTIFKNNVYVTGIIFEKW